ncbi:MAG: class I SAM-dependent methyltransferase [Gemmatimonadota bacterium]
MIERLGPYLEEREVTTALDVGCGTGASTRPLTRVARRVVGLDPSLAMLAQAPRPSEPAYVAGRGEELPFRTDSFDLLTVSLTFHWLERERFLHEGLRVLRRSGLVVVYDNFFAGRAEDEDEDLDPWMRDIYWRRYPYPPRFSVDFAPGEKIEPGFRCEIRDEYKNTVEFTRERLVDYLVTQTNVISAIEEGKEDIDEVRRWLLRELISFFEGREFRSLIFEGPIWILRRDEQERTTRNSWERSHIASETASSCAASACARPSESHQELE